METDGNNMLDGTAVQVGRIKSDGTIKYVHGNHQRKKETSTSFYMENLHQETGGNE